MRSVENGAALLDERLPGWREEIDPDTLTLSNGEYCVLGQIFGDYDRGRRVLRLSHRDAQRLGFTVNPRSTWERLTDAWRALIA